MTQKNQDIGTLNPKHLANMKLSRILKSRNTWREKALQRNKEKQKLARKVAVLQSHNTNLKLRVEELNSELELARENNLVPVVSPIQVNFEIRITCLMLFVLGKIPVNAVNRVLQYLTSHRLLSFDWVPDPSSIVNWIGRAGLGLLNSISTSKKPWIAIIDASIAFGKAKVMVVLRVPLDVLNSGKAPTLSDAECIALSVKTAWSGEDVHALLAETIHIAGMPVAILKDGGSDLSKGVSLLRKQFPSIFSIQDLGHVVANALKSKYSEKSAFDQLLEIANSGRKRLFLTLLSTLRPPKIRTKGRFQNISKLLEWAREMQELIGGQGRSANGTLKSQLRKALLGLSQIKSFVDTFASECEILNKVQAKLKNQGLNQASFKEVSADIETLPDGCPIRATMLAWLTRHLRVQCQLGIAQTPLLVSSDVLESLMGQLKFIIERMPVPEFTTMTLAIPLLCGNQNSESLQAALTNCPHKKLTSWRSEHCAHSKRHVKSEVARYIRQNTGPKTLQRHAA